MVIEAGDCKTWSHCSKWFSQDGSLSVYLCLLLLSFSLCLLLFLSLFSLSVLLSLPPSLPLLLFLSVSVSVSQPRSPSVRLSVSPLSPSLCLSLPPSQPWIRRLPAGAKGRGTEIGAWLQTGGVGWVGWTVSMLTLGTHAAAENKWSRLKTAPLHSKASPRRAGAAWTIQDLVTGSGFKGPNPTSEALFTLVTLARSFS